MVNKPRCVGYIGQWIKILEGRGGKRCDRRRKRDSSTQYYNIIVGLDSMWVDVELVTVAVYWHRRRRDGNITI